MSNVRTSLINCRALWNKSWAYSKNNQKNISAVYTREISTSMRVFGEIKDEKINKNSATNVNNINIKDENKPSKLKQTGKLAKIFAEYGTTAVVFHTAISLTSLGLSYTAVSSGIDIVALLQKLNLITDVTTESKIATGASTFVIAYACHKVLMPVRIFLTATCTPFIVKKLRTIGILKTPDNKNIS
ncbi:protein FAM210B, mitochondrial isoform X2 [Hydra vulgaris]|uniref:Protein FAM210B, mitochondrial isoform X2 n=1 Tax=Hydra vulgaris TaxID=6087 RepID=A0ABM4DL14_HYDVU